MQYDEELGTEVPNPRSERMTDLWTCSRCGAASGLLASKPRHWAAVSRRTGTVVLSPQPISEDWLSCETYAVHAVLSS